MAKKTNDTKTARIQISLDEMSAGVLDKIASFGPLGKTRTEVATKIIQEWVREKGASEVEELEKLKNL